MQMEYISSEDEKGSHKIKHKNATFVIIDTLLYQMLYISN